LLRVPRDGLAGPTTLPRSFGQGAASLGLLGQADSLNRRATSAGFSMTRLRSAILGADVL
jgi:hypothetical protein